jgi:hypothetical protein
MKSVLDAVHKLSEDATHLKNVNATHKSQINTVQETGDHHPWKLGDQSQGSSSSRVGPQANTEVDYTTKGASYQKVPGVVLRLLILDPWPTGCVIALFCGRFMPDWVYSLSTPVKRIEDET